VRGSNTESIQYFDFNSILELYKGLEVKKGIRRHFHTYKGIEKSP
jgi:hypothetical protein